MRSCVKWDRARDLSFKAIQKVFFSNETCEKNVFHNALPIHICIRSTDRVDNKWMEARKLRRESRESFPIGGLNEDFAISSSATIYFILCYSAI